MLPKRFGIAEHGNRTTRLFVFVLFVLVVASVFWLRQDGSKNGDKSKSKLQNYEMPKFDIDFASEERPLIDDLDDPSTMFQPFLKRLKVLFPHADYSKILKKKLDVIIIWKPIISDTWKVGAKNSASERTAFLNFTLPNLLPCDFCEFWLYTSLAPDMFDDELVSAFKKLNINFHFHNPDSISKFLAYKFMVNKELFTVAVDNDDFVEYDYFYNLMVDLKSRNLKPSDKVQICYRPQDYYDFFPFHGNETRIRKFPDSHTLRIMMGLYVRGVYNDVISMDHMLFGNAPGYLDCELRSVNSSGFYTRRADSSSGQLTNGAKEMLDFYAQASRWNDYKDNFKVFLPQMN